MTPDGDKPCLQPRCPNCLLELWGAAVLAFSYGGCMCGGCGYVSQVMTAAEYRAALADTRSRLYGSN